MLHSQSPKLTALEQKNEELLRQQEALQEQLEQQKAQQEEIMAKLNEKGLLASQRPEATTPEEIGSIIQETQSKKMEVLRYNCEIFALKQICVLIKTNVLKANLWDFEKKGGMIALCASEGEKISACVEG